MSSTQITVTTGPLGWTVAVFRSHPLSTDWVPVERYRGTLTGARDICLQDLKERYPDVEPKHVAA